MVAEEWRNNQGHGLSEQRRTLEGRVLPVVGSTRAGAHAGTEQTASSVTRIMETGVVA